MNTQEPLYRFIPGGELSDDQWWEIFGELAGRMGWTGFTSAVPFIKRHSFAIDQDGSFLFVYRDL